MPAAKARSAGVSRAPADPAVEPAAARLIGFIVTYRTRVDTVAAGDGDVDAIGVSLE
jgi:hypothetical protein